MCRLLAYLGPETSLASLVLDPPFCLLRQSYAPRFQQRGRFNADGFGVGWYDPSVRPEPALYRRATPLWSDRSFASLAPLVRAGVVLASVRNATPPSPTEETSTPPYTSGPWLFAHNGEVNGFPHGGRARLLEGISPLRASGIEGTADSEVLFAMVLDRLDAGEAPAEALVGVVDTVLSGQGGRLNMVLTDGQHLAATSCGDSLYVREPAQGTGGLIVASEPFDDEPQWREVPDGSIVLGQAGEAPRIEAMSR